MNLSDFEWLGQNIRAEKLLGSDSAPASIFLLQDKYGIELLVRDGYLIPDFKWEEFQMVKHRSSIRLCWRRYCKRAAKQNLVSYSWKVFLSSYNDYRRPKIQVDDPDDKIRTKLKHYNFLLAYCESDKVMYSVIQTEKEMWLKSLGLDESKIIGDREK